MEFKNLNGVEPRLDTSRRAAANSPAATEPPGGRASGSSAGAPTDQVTLTDSARRLMEASRAGLVAPPVDSARVANIRQAIAEGRYDISAERIAAALLRLEDDLPG